MTHEISAHITGTVWKVLAQVGEDVEQDQVLAILESMKMEMPLESPEPGRIVEVLATPGQAVEEGDVLFRLSPA
jgi:acetyl-CoA carboxylase biotin carboxyl carrier protein